MDFSRVEALPGMGPHGQAAIGKAHVLVVGVGGLGCPAARYLGAAGIGTLTLVDFDTVSPSDLHRQILFAPGDEGQFKAELAASRLAGHSPSTVHGQVATFDASMLAGVDVVLDCTDEPGSRALIHEACLAAGVPLVWAAVEGWEGQGAVVAPGGPCLRCLWPEPAPAPSCAEAGVLGPFVGMLGCWQATQALRLVAGLNVPLGVLHLCSPDGWSTIEFGARADCGCAERTK